MLGTVNHHRSFCLLPEPATTIRDRWWRGYVHWGITFKNICVGEGGQDRGWNIVLVHVRHYQAYHDELKACLIRERDRVDYSHTCTIIDSFVEVVREFSKVNQTSAPGKKYAQIELYSNKDERITALS
jgi:hypothetical protein